MIEGGKGDIILFMRIRTLPPKMLASSHKAECPFLPSLGEESPERTTNRQESERVCPVRVRARAPRRGARVSAAHRNQGARWLWLALCVLVASFFGIRAYREGGGPPAPLAAAVAVERAPFRPSRAIETIRVGDRVLTHNANPSAAGAPAGTAVNPATWRKLVLRARDQWPDGTLDTINVETLQPPEWITANRAEVGTVVPLPLDLTEMGMRADLRAGRGKRAMSTH